MDKLIIEGGRKLEGTVTISGSKNASLPALAATILANGKSVLSNVPGLADIQTMEALLSHLGAKVEIDGNVAMVDASSIHDLEAPYEIVRKMRASCLVLGPLLARFGRARISLPGGCAIGARPIDMHLHGLEQMGAKVLLEHGYVDAVAPAGGLKGAKIVFDVSTVTGTENLMMAATLAKGTTVLENAAREPEVVELAEALIQMGAKIAGIGTNTIQVEGVSSLRPMEHTVGPDRIESGTFVAAAAITGGDVLIRGIRADHLEAVITQFEKIGCQIDGARPTHGVTDLRVKGPERLLAADIRTAPYPGFPTDMQAQLMACMAVAEGTSHVEETIWENRFMHALELMRMGADIALHGGLAVVKGSAILSGAPVMATDLRASASLVLAGLRAQGTTEVLRIYHLDRGYDKIERKLAALGAQVTRAKQ